MIDEAKLEEYGVLGMKVIVLASGLMLGIAVAVVVAACSGTARDAGVDSAHVGTSSVSTTTTATKAK